MIPLQYRDALSRFIFEITFQILLLATALNLCDFMTAYFVGKTRQFCVDMKVA